MSFLNKHFFAGMAVGGLLTAVLLVGGLVLISVFWAQPIIKKAATRVPNLTTREPFAPIRPGADWTVRDLGGAPFSIAAQRGKVVFLNQWATWCGPCVAEMPSIQALYDSLHAEGVVFALVSDEEPEKVRSFMRKNGYSLPVYLSGESVPGPYRSRGIPTTHILDRSGNIVAEHTGTADWNAAVCRDYLRRLLAR